MLTGNGSLSLRSMAFKLPDTVLRDLGRRPARYHGPLPLRPPAQERPQPRPAPHDQLRHLHHHVHLPPLRHHEEGDLRIRGQLPSLHPHLPSIPHPHIAEVLIPYILPKKIIWSPSEEVHIAFRLLCNLSLSTTFGFSFLYITRYLYLYLDLYLDWYLNLYVYLQPFFVNHLLIFLPQYHQVFPFISKCSSLAQKIILSM